MKCKQACWGATTMGACVSDDGKYRYGLWRYWSSVARGPQLGFIMLNPSIADATVDDPTIRRCLGFAKREGCEGIVVCNLLPLVSTDPHEIDIKADELPAGVMEENDAHLRSMIDHCEKIVCAWGAGADSLGLDWAVQRVFDIIGATRPLYALGFTKSGQPRHPLYLAKNSGLQWFAPTTAKENAPQ